jgi:hypothetical protein
MATEGLALMTKAATSQDFDVKFDVDADVEAAIEACGGDPKAALRATLITNAFLEANLENLLATVSTGFTRGKPRPRPVRSDSDKKTT